MPYFPILQKPTQNNLITKTSFRQDASSPRSITMQKPPKRGLPHRRDAKNRRRAVSYVSTGLACLPRDNNASPIYRRRAVSYVSTGLACLPRDNNARASTAEERLYKRQHMVGLHSLVAERRHSSVTRYAKRSVACRDSPRHQPLRAGGTPLPRHPSDCASPSSTIHRFAPSARCIIAIGEKTAFGGCRRPRRAKKDRWLGFQPSVSVSLRSAVRLLVDNTTLFDTSLLASKVAQIVQFCTTHFTKLVDCDAVDKR